MWPTDSQFLEGWLNEQAYHRLTSAQIRLIMTNLNQTYLSSRVEPLSFTETPHIEHLMPQSWYQHWPLPDGTTLSWDESLIIDDEDDRWVLYKRRQSLIHTLGNLTLLSAALNGEQSNLPWAEKREALNQNSLLHMNRDIANYETWTENSIQKRGKELFERAKEIWKR